MSLVRLIRSAVMRRFADPERRSAQRLRAEQQRQRQGRSHEVLYFHQVDDPYSQLAVQALPALLARYDIRLQARVVAAATPIAIHEQGLWDRWALRDCAAIAPFYGLQFSPQAGPPEAALVELARGIAIATESLPDFATTAMALTEALHGGSRTALDTLARTLPPITGSAAQARLAANFQLRHRLGHYLGAMLYYEGEWYWGIDRLHYLEARLDALGARRDAAPAGPSVQLRRSAPTASKVGKRLQLEYFPSLRSPYTHLSYPRVAELCQRYPVDLVLRPVLPMMMRGVKADRRKGQYILQDTLREAERLGIAFGNIWDPFGKPILRAYSLFPWARASGRAFEYFHTYSAAVWSQRVDAWSLSGLKGIVEAAGLTWAEALPHLDSRDWEVEMEANVQAMIAAGSWGVPTLRLPAAEGEPEYTVWGQDRIWLIEEEIQRRLRAD